MSFELSNFVLTFTLLLTSTILIVFYINYKLKYWKRKGVKSLPVNYIFGNFKDAILFRSTPGWNLDQIYKAADKESPFIGFYIIHRPCLLLRDPKIIKQFFVNDSDKFSDRPSVGSLQDTVGVKNLLKNPEWKYLGSNITPLVAMDKLKQMFSLMVESGRPMMKFIDGLNVNECEQKLLDVREINVKYATDLIAVIALDTKVDSFYHPNHEFSRFVSNYFYSLKRLTDTLKLFFPPELVEQLSNKILFNSKSFKKFFWDTMDSREKSIKERSDFIVSLNALKNDERGTDYKSEDDNLVYQSTAFFSGFESSATTASFALLRLAESTECQEKARENIKRGIDKHGMTYEAFTDMKYLDQAILETIRLHPPVSTIDRYTRCDYKISGTDVVLENGTAVYVSLYGLQGDDNYFNDPLTFDPDRFKDAMPEAYLPFGTVDSQCVGMKVAMLHVKVVIGLILMDYKITQKPNEKSVVDLRSRFTASKDGIKLYFEKIEPTCCQN